VLQGSSDRLSIMIFYCKFFMSWLRAFWAWKMLPKEVWFQCLILIFKCLSFCWNWDILEPLEGEKLLQVELTNLLNSRWDIQKASKWNGHQIFWPRRFHWRAIGQWSEPDIDRIEVANSPPKWIALSDNRNLSSYEEIWCDPSLLLFHGNKPLLEGISISQLFWM